MAEQWTVDSALARADSTEYLADGTQPASGGGDRIAGARRLRARRRREDITEKLARSGRNSSFQS